MTASRHFEQLLQEHKLGQVDRAGNVVMGLWPELTLAYFNQAWFAFARANGGEPAISARWPLGRSWLACLPPPLEPFYAGHYRRALDENVTWDHDYECSSRAVYRQFHQRVYPLAGEGLLVVNSLTVERPHDPRERPRQQPARQLYADRNDLIHQCCHCRRVKNLAQEHRWDWVPAWVEAPPQATTHGLCPACLGYYYGLERSD